tara:strand:- start:389 stop:850 length:462 start_codon:yes stop_codon:yes gene_type:complete
MKNLRNIFLVLFTINIVFGNEIEKNKILNIMVDINYELINPKKQNLDIYFDYPFSYNLEDQTLFATNNRELKKLFKKIRKGFKKDYSYSDWKKMNVKLLNNNIAIVNAMFSRLNKNSETYYTGAAMYIFRKTENKWKVFSITPLKPYNYFEFD